ncbi:pH regulation protein F [bacterium]|nr:pH regulation protein F [bacterium]
MTAPLTAAAVLALFAVVALWRVFRGPTVFDRLVGVGVISTKVLVILLLLGLAWDRFEAFLDIAIGYALLSFIGTMVAARYCERRGQSP